jgi:hypothetical protein
MAGQHVSGALFRHWFGERLVSVKKDAQVRFWRPPQSDGLARYRSSALDPRSELRVPVVEVLQVSSVEHSVELEQEQPETEHERGTSSSNAESIVHVAGP